MIAWQNALIAIVEVGNGWSNDPQGILGGHHVSPAMAEDLNKRGFVTLQSMPAGYCRLYPTRAGVIEAINLKPDLLDIYPQFKDDVVIE